MSVTSPSTEARLALQAIILAEFSAENYPVASGFLHGAVGLKGTQIGLSPVSENPWSRDSNVLIISILVQFYGRWKDEAIVSPEIRIDPITIETFAERFRRSLKGQDQHLDNSWYFTITNLTYPLDPMGQKTRFEATVTSYANNSQIIETTG